MGFFFWLIVVFFGIYMFFRVFGRVIIQFFLKEVLKKVVKEAENQQMDYERFYDGGAFQENVYVDEEIKVSVPKEKSKPKISPDEIAEDIDFEDI